MARSDYPLKALRELRDERAEALAQRLAAQVVRTQRAEGKLRERERARQKHAEGVSAAVAAEQARLAESGVSGVELLRVADYQVAAREQALLLERAERDARQELSGERAEEQKIREEQAAREAEAKLVRNHEARFERDVAERQAKAEEESALEQWNARRR